MNDMPIPCGTSLNFALKISQPCSVKHTQTFVGPSTAICTQEEEVMTSGTLRKMDRTNMNMNRTIYHSSFNTVITIVLLDETVSSLHQKLAHLPSLGRCFLAVAPAEARHKGGRGGGG